MHAPLTHTLIGKHTHTSHTHAHTHLLRALIDEKRECHVTVRLEGGEYPRTDFVKRELYISLDDKVPVVRVCSRVEVGQRGKRGSKSNKEMREYTRFTVV
jgi:hypothetical protein